MHGETLKNMGMFPLRKEITGRI